MVVPRTVRERSASACVLPSTRACVVRKQTPLTAKMYPSTQPPSDAAAPTTPYATW